MTWRVQICTFHLILLHFSTWSLKVMVPHEKWNMPSRVRLKFLLDVNWVYKVKFWITIFFPKDNCFLWKVKYAERSEVENFWDLPVDTTQNPLVLTIFNIVFPERNWSPNFKGGGGTWLKFGPELMGFWGFGIWIRERFLKKNSPVFTAHIPASLYNGNTPHGSAIFFWSPTSS